MEVFLETDRLVLRRFAEADVDHLVALHNDPDVMRFLTGGKPMPRQEVEREYRERFAEPGYWVQSSGRPGSSWSGSPSTPWQTATPVRSSSATGYARRRGARATPRKGRAH